MAAAMSRERIARRTGWRLLQVKSDAQLQMRDDDYQVPEHSVSPYKPPTELGRSARVLLVLKALLGSSIRLHVAANTKKERDSHPEHESRAHGQNQEPPDHPHDALAYQMTRGAR